MRMILNENGQDLSEKLFREGSQIIVSWTEMPVPLPPVTYEEYSKDASQMKDERRLSFTPNYMDSDDAVAHEQQYALALKAYKDADACYRQPLLEALSHYIQSICANVQNFQGYLGAAYICLVVENYPLARRYIEHVLMYIDKNNKNALAFLERVNEYETKNGQAGNHRRDVAQAGEEP